MTKIIQLNDKDKTIVDCSSINMLREGPKRFCGYFELIGYTLELVIGGKCIVCIYDFAPNNIESEEKCFNTYFGDYETLKQILLKTEEV